MCSEDPETVMLPPERLHALPLRHVPHTDRLIFRVRNDQLLQRESCETSRLRGQPADQRGMDAVDGISASCAPA